MAIQKSEAMRTLTAECQSEFNLLEKKIDDEIRRYYIGGGVRIDINQLPNEKVQNALEKVYREVGWEMSFYDDQREGAYVFLR